MARLINAFEQCFDSDGEPLESGLLDFFESGSSTIRKTTYADAAETIVNSNPVVLNGDGRAPNIFGGGTYNVILRTSDGVQILARDPVGGDTGVSFGADWSATQTYGISDVVRDDSKYWISSAPGNAGNRPSLDGGANWTEADFTQIPNIATNTANIASNTEAIDSMGWFIVNQLIAAGVAGGGSLGVQTRILDNEVINTIAGASLSSNQVTIPAGSYIVTAKAPAFKSNAHQIVLRNITDGQTSIVGSSAYNDIGINVQNYSHIHGALVITSEKTFDLYHYIGSTKADNGLGLQTGSGLNTEFSSLSFQKIA